MSFCIAITGPAGAGKSTVSEKLAKQLDHTVNIDGDHIKHMIVSGFYKDPTNPGGWSYNQWGLVGESIGLLAKNFQHHGFDVIINGYLDQPCWDEIEKLIPLTHKILLLPQPDTVVKRDKARREDVRMGEATVKQHHNHFSTDLSFGTFTKLDTTNHSVDETVEAIRTLLG